MQPWTTFTGDQHIAQGFDFLSRAFDEAIRDEQAAAQQRMQRRAHDLGYFGGEADRAANYYGIDTSAATQRRGQDLDAAKEESRIDPSRIQPRALIDPATGQPIPGMFGIPMTGQVIETRSGGGAAGGQNILGVPITGPDGQPLGHVVTLPSGKEQVLRPQAGGSGGRVPGAAVPLITGELASMQATQESLADIDRQLAEHQKQINAGDTRTGFLNLWSREGEKKALSEKRAKLVQELAAAEGRIATTKRTFGSEPAATVRTPAPKQNRPTTPVVEPPPPMGAGEHGFNASLPEELPPPNMTAQDQAAAAWAAANPGDPRAAKIKQRLGLP